jgi:putative MATE family efflux protein
VSLGRFNPLRALLLAIGSGLATLGVIDRERAVRATDLSWPRIVTGLARMSKSAADVAMVGIAVGPAAIAGVGFATPFWGLAFALGTGVAGGTISLVSQRYGADAHEELAVVVKASAVLVVGISMPLAVVCALAPRFLISLVGADAHAIELGATYLQIVAVGMPIAVLNLVGSRTLVGADDAWTPMILRAGGAAVNIGLNAILIFGFGLGVVGAALGTVLANVIVAVAFGVAFTTGHGPATGRVPVTIPLTRPYFDVGIARDLVSISTPLVLTNVVRRGADFPKIAIVALFGPNVVAAYVVATQVRALMDTPNWGFSLASSSLVGQALGTGDEREAGAWASDVLRLSLAIYGLIAIGVLLFADPIGALFVDDPAIRPLVSTFLLAACVSVLFRGVEGGATGPLRASGDTRWPL